MDLNEQKAQIIFDFVATSIKHMEQVFRSKGLTKEAEECRRKFDVLNFDEHELSKSVGDDDGDDAIGDDNTYPDGSPV